MATETMTLWDIDKFIKLDLSIIKNYCKIAMSIIKSNSKIYKPMSYEKIINDLIYGYRW